MDAPIITSKQPQPFETVVANFPQICGYLDSRSFLNLTRCSRSFRKNDDLWKANTVALTTHKCYPPIVTSWKKAYTLYVKPPESVGTNNPSQLLRLPRETRTQIAKYLDGKSLARLSETCKELYDNFNSEDIWKLVYINDNLGYCPEIRHWKKSYYRQALIERNFRKKNIKDSGLLDYNTLFLNDRVHSISKYFYSIFDEKGILSHSTLPYSSNSVLQTKVLSGDCLAITDNFEFRIRKTDYNNWNSSPSISIWKNGKLTSLHKREGFYTFHEHFMVRSDTHNLEVWNYETNRLVKRLVNMNAYVLGIGGSVLITYIPRNSIIAHDLITGEVLYNTPFPQDFVYDAMTTLPASKVNDRFAVIQEERGVKIWAFPIQSAEDIFCVETCSYKAGFHLEGNLLYGADVQNKSQINCTDLVTNTVVQIFKSEIPNFNISQFIIDGNRLLMSGFRTLDPSGKTTECSLELWDVETVKKIYTVISSIGFSELKVHAGILYHTNQKVLVMRKFSNGEVLGEMEFTYEDKIYDGHIVSHSKKQITDLNQPLPKQTNNEASKV